MGCRISGFRFRIKASGFGFGVQGLGFEVRGFGWRGQDLEVGVWGGGRGLRVWGLQRVIQLRLCELQFGARFEKVCFRTFLVQGRVLEIGFQGHDPPLPYMKSFGRDQGQKVQWIALQHFKTHVVTKSCDFERSSSRVESWR